MGNCLPLCRHKNKSQAPRVVTKNESFLHIVKNQDKILEHKRPMILEDISKDMDGASCGKRVRLIITKQELQELVSKKISVDEMLLRIQREAGISGGNNCGTRWKPVLETILE
ncbi:hypothetical protein PRUPE_5G132100 [Prunus persica]|uniref:Uncharacterized protein n=1 Tax=Prunus persica TaxID=3760 RepID=M5W9V1_PRUPE|nr:hypothetical protein PRUPE_5G132100 [Prunus persica]